MTALPPQGRLERTTESHGNELYSGMRGIERISAEETIKGIKSRRGGERVRWDGAVRWCRPLDTATLLAPNTPETHRRRRRLYPMAGPSPRSAIVPLVFKSSGELETQNKSYEVSPSLQ